MKIEKIDINKIKPYEKNAKIHTPEQIEQIKKSIQEFGMNDPIAVWGKDNLIVEGHGRLEALKQLGYTEIECIRLDHLTDEERRAYTLAHNKLTMNTDFDIDILNDELFNIDNIDMELFGFDVELPIEEHELTEDDYEVEVPEEPKAKPGDIYQLGEHRIMCGDSTSTADVKKLLAGAIVDLAYEKEEDPKVAVEILIGHGEANVIIESSANFYHDEIEDIVWRIAGEDIAVRLNSVKQDAHLSKNQEGKVRCGDNGIFKGVPLTENEKEISRIAREIYEQYPTDGKYILTDHELIICQSNADSKELTAYALGKRPYVAVNPIGDWTGGTNVDSGATNRKLGSDMAQSVTGGGLHGKDLSKADVSVNIYAFLKAQETGKVQEFHCAIGDEAIDGKDYSEIVEIARKYIKNIGGFEKFAEWGLF